MKALSEGGWATFEEICKLVTTGAAMHYPNTKATG